MTPAETLSLVIALLSLAVALWAAFRASRLSSYEIRLGRRMELHALLQEVDAECLHDQSLNEMFRSSGSNGPLPPKAKQQTYVVMYLNVFEAAHSIFRETHGLSDDEIEVKEAWERFLEHFMRDCIPAVEIWSLYKDSYYASFQSAVDGVIARLDQILPANINVSSGPTG